MIDIVDTFPRASALEKIFRSEIMYLLKLYISRIYLINASSPDR